MPQHLSIQSPSPSTISYSVSTRSPSRFRVWRALNYTTRITIAYYAVLTFLVKARANKLLDSRYVPLVDLFEHFSAPVSTRLKDVTALWSWWAVAGSSLVVLFFCLRRFYVDETLLVVQGLGVQTSTSSAYFLVNPTTTFIPTTQIQDIVIHEAFKGFEVRFFLAIIVEGASEVVVVFPHLLPKREVLEQVWRGSRKCLYGGNK